MTVYLTRDEIDIYKYLLACEFIDIQELSKDLSVKEGPLLHVLRRLMIAGYATKSANGYYRAVRNKELPT